MDFLLLILAITVKYGLTSDLLDAYEPEYFPNTPHEHPQNEYSIDLTPTDYRRINYNDLLSLLHNENSDRAVLAHIDNKEDEIGEGDEGNRMKREDESKASEKTEHVRLKKNSATKLLKNLFQGKNKTASKIKDEDVNNLTLDKSKNEEIVRLKRNSALKMFRNLFHGKNKNVTINEPTPVYLKRSHEINVNYTIVDLLRNLTGAVYTLNQNLEDLKIEATKEKEFVLIKMPLANVDATVEINERNSSRTKRDATTAKLVETNVNSNIANNSIHANDNEKKSAKNTTIDHQKSSTVVHKTVTTAKSEVPSKAYKLNANKTNVAKHLEIKLNNNTRVNVTDENKTKNIKEKHDPNATKPKREANATTPLKTHINVNVNNTPANATEKNESKKIKNKSKQANTTNSKSKSDNIDLDKERNAKANMSDLSNQRIDEIMDNASIRLNKDSTEHPNEKENDSIVLKGNNRRAMDVDTKIEPVDDNEELLCLIYQTYRDIEEKILPMNDVKAKYSSKQFYKIGYIVANLETLEVALNKLKTKLGVNKNVWKKEKLQKIIKKLIMTKYLVDNIMDYLNQYINNVYNTNRIIYQTDK